MRVIRLQEAIAQLNMAIGNKNSNTYPPYIAIISIKPNFQLTQWQVSYT